MTPNPHYDRTPEAGVLRDVHRQPHLFLKLAQNALTVADRLSARGKGPIASPEMVSAHLQLAREMIAAALDWRREGPPPPLLRGDEVAAELGIEPGPEWGSALAELEAAQYAGEITDRRGALQHLRR